MDIPPLVHFICETKGRFVRDLVSLRSKGRGRKGRGGVAVKGGGGGRAECEPGRAPKCKHISPCPWSEGDGRKIFVGRTASMRPGIGFNSFEKRGRFNFLKQA